MFLIISSSCSLKMFRTFDTTIAVVLFQCNNRVEDNSLVFAGPSFVITWKMPALFLATTRPLVCTPGPEIDPVRVEPGTSCAFQGRFCRRSACAPDISYSPCLPRSVIAAMIAAAIRARRVGLGSFASFCQSGGDFWSSPINRHPQSPSAGRKSAMNRCRPYSPA